MIFERMKDINMPDYIKAGILIPIIAQIWGKNPEHFAETVKALEPLGFQGVDLNFGCPDKNVNRAGGGAAMIKTPDLAVTCLKKPVEFFIRERMGDILSSVEFTDHIDSIE